MRSTMPGMSPTEAVIYHPVAVSGVLGWLQTIPEGRAALRRVALMMGETETGQLARVLADNADAARVRLSIPFDLVHYAGGPALSLRTFGTQPGDPTWNVDDGRQHEH